MEEFSWFSKFRKFFEVDLDSGSSRKLDRLLFLVFLAPVFKLSSLNWSLPQISWFHLPFSSLAIEITIVSPFLTTSNLLLETLSKNGPILSSVFSEFGQEIVRIIIFFFSFILIRSVDKLSSLSTLRNILGGQSLLKRTYLTLELDSSHWYNFAACISDELFSTVN